MRALAAVALAVVVAGCGTSSDAPTSSARGPAGVVRVALEDFRWPLDPAFVSGRDEQTIARAVFATPLRTDARGGLRAGLCTRWSSRDGGRTWTFRCAHARAIADELARMRRLPAAPTGWLFEPIGRIERGGGEVTVRLRFRWLRFPYVLTTAAASPRGVRGPFRIAGASPHALVVARPGLRVRFVRMRADDAVSAWRNGDVDEAPIPVGDVRRVQLDPATRGGLRVRPLLGLDLVSFRLRGGALADLPHTRQVYWRTAARADYAALVPERAPPAFALAGQAAAPSASAVRTARNDAPSLPPVAVPIATPPQLADAAELLVASWRELGLGPFVATRADTARFERLVAAYPQREAIAAALLLPEDERNPWLHAPSRARSLLLAALTERDQRSLRRLDALLRSEAAVVPIAGVVGTRLVSPRLEGWRQDALGVVDYSAVRSRASSRRP